MTFRVDTDAVAELAAALTQLDGVFDEQLAHIAARMERLSGSWSSETAAAYQSLHTAWQADARAMRAAAAALQHAAETAHGNYTGGVAANLSMWGG